MFKQILVIFFQHFFIWNFHEKVIVTKLVKHFPCLFVVYQVSLLYAQEAATGLFLERQIQYAALDPVSLRIVLLLY
jgi:hypothetical protein